jgi:hypothetical protein
MAVTWTPAAVGVNYVCEDELQQLARACTAPAALEHQSLLYGFVYLRGWSPTFSQLLSWCLLGEKRWLKIVWR